VARCPSLASALTRSSTLVSLTSISRKL
jgi:hypothetical protein